MQADSSADIVVASAEQAVVHTVGPVAGIAAELAASVAEPVLSEVQLLLLLLLPQPSVHGFSVLRMPTQRAIRLVRQPSQPRRLPTYRLPLLSVRSTS